jgi:hypothetical protein
VDVEPVVVEVPRQEHALEIFEGVAEHAEVYDGIVVLAYPGEVYCWQKSSASVELPRSSLRQLSASQSGYKTKQEGQKRRPKTLIFRL